MYLSAAEFRAKRCYKELPAGELSVEYHDSTHHAAGRFEPLLSVDIKRPNIQLDEDSEAFYSLQRTISVGTKDADASILSDTLSLSLARVGLIAPTLSEELYQEIDSLNSESGVILIADTNSLYNGTIHWLIDTLRRPVVWLLPFVMSLTQIQQRDAGLKSMVGKRKETNLAQALRSRALVNASLGLLERNKGKYQVLELDPSLLRYMRPSGKGTVDHDQGDVLEDRLFVEGIHAVLRSTRTRASQRVVTSDILLARILRTEGVPTLYIPPPRLDAQKVSCLRYDPLVKDFRGAPLADLIWDLAHAFSTIRVTSEGAHQFTASAYWPNKMPHDWHLEKLYIQESNETIAVPIVEGVQATPTSDPGLEPLSATKGPLAQQDLVPALPRPIDRPETLERPHMGEGVEVLPAPQNPQEIAISSAQLPQASVPQILRLSAVVYDLNKPLAVSEVIRNLVDDRPTDGVARRALEVMRRTELIRYEGGLIYAGSSLRRLKHYLDIGDLDGISGIFKRFLPYEIILDALVERGSMLRTEVEPLLSDRLGVVGKESSLRVLRYHSCLGQAWTFGDSIRDGSQRLSDRQAISMFLEVFSESCKDGLASVLDVLTQFCIRGRVSPWAAQRQLKRIISEGGFPSLIFQPAAGARPVVSDPVLSGTLESFELTPIPMDRILIGDRPIFTISGTTQ
ncbi:hypothetical protein MKL09_00800 [Methylobacterium sp. J-048]|uniref:hypothetical protein n=1 Tax=Methylobacterium sp. J-048 TaxID=2836635 RepID=UPI001FBB7F17|nr:hypothetical protein [Methylobacterium sp. J-048]MCJ2055095.1 hypothetical protein [Methylobacterium sp. J-048]